MVGILTEEILPNRRLAEMGIDAIPSSTGEVIGAAFEDAWERSPGPSAARWLGRELTVSSERYLTADQANRDFGIEGHLTFDAAVPPHQARELHELKRAELRRKDILSRAEGGFWEGAGQLGAGLLASVLDPLNVASAFIPVVGPARYALALEQAGSAIGRAGVRAGYGAIEGAAGAALLEPIAYGVARQEQADYHAVDSLLNIAFGGVLGGGLHMGAGAIGDALRPGRWRPPLSDRFGALPQETREAAMRAGVAAIADDRPVTGLELIVQEQQALLQGRAQARAEVEALRADPTLSPGPASEVLAMLTPETMREVVEVRRGAVMRADDGDLTLPKRGAEGLIKLEVKHPDVTDEEVLALPLVLRQQAGVQISQSAETTVWEWRRHMNGAEVVYRLKDRAKTKDAGKRYLLTIFKRTDPADFKGETPRLGEAPAAPSPSGSTGSFVQDTAQAFSGQKPGGQRGPASRNMGRRPAQSNLGTVFDSGGQRLDVRYEVVELADLVTSHTDDLGINPAYPATLQPRDRSRATSGGQITDIVSRFEPGMLMRSPDASTGAPIVGPDGIVESGNGRTLALRKIYAEAPDKARHYQAELVRQGHRVAGFKQPVLVARRLTDLDPDALRGFTVAAQKARTLDMSATERAQADAHLLDGILDLYRGGDVNAVGNAALRTAFAERLPQTDHGSLIAADKTFSADGIRRFRNALLARAFDDADLLARMIEAPDDASKALSGALFDVAPAWARMRAAVEAGEIAPGVDATADLLDAIGAIRDARAAGRPLDHILTQVDAFDQRSAATDLFLGLMLKGKTTNSREAITDGLMRYVDEAMKSTPHADMFGTAPPTGAELARALRRHDPTAPPPDDAAIADAVARRFKERPKAPADALAAEVTTLDGDIARLRQLGRLKGDEPELAELAALQGEASARRLERDAAAFCLSRG